MHNFLWCMIVSPNIWGFRVLKFIKLVCLYCHFQKIKEFKICGANENPTTGQKYLANILWFISTSRNIIVVLFCSVMAFIFVQKNGSAPFALSSKLIYFLNLCINFVYLSAWLFFIIFFKNFISTCAMFFAEISRKSSIAWAKGNLNLWESTN